MISVKSGLILLSLLAFVNSIPAKNVRAEKDWWENSVFYQIYPRSFMDSDGDGVGDLKGITSRLQHLKDSGIGATWLSPFFKSPQFDSGYDISDFFDIHEEYGTMADFEELISEAERLDIKIILDFVPNHSSHLCDWFIQSLNKSSEYADWYIWEDGKTDANGTRLPPNNWVSVFRKSAWEYRPERDQFYLHQFTVQQPDLNYRNPAVVEKMKDVLKFWINKGAAGFRMDAVNHIFEVDKNDFGGQFPDEPLSGNPGQGPDDFGYLDHIYTINLDPTYDLIYEFREVVDEFKQQDNFTRVILTEAYASIENTMRYYGNGEKEGSHMPFNFALIENVNEFSTAKDIKFYTDRWMTYMPLGKTANWVIGNHDKWRVGTRYGAERIDGLHMINMLLPGVGITYNGEEIGMLNTNITWEDTKDPQACNTDDPINYWMSSRDPARTPFQWNDEENAGFSTANKTWLPVNENYVELNLKKQKSESNSHYNIYKNLVVLRSVDTFMYGRFDSVAFNDDVFSFERGNEGCCTKLVFR
ncbi:maltase A1-like isoform X2 [Arctopsyche grandis]|uniref:maltase A1-like isoform X2 n=1 Tax=Arctopsyche grandis TaxID=121162 RepID=UPI00406D660C